MLLFFQLYLAHLVADFLLQPDWVARRKTEVRPLSAHAATHLLCAAAAVNLGLDRRVAGAIVAVALIHTCSTMRRPGSQVTAGSRSRRIRRRTSWSSLWPRSGSRPRGPG